MRTSDQAHRATGKIPLSAAELNARIDAYVEAHWNDVVSDIDALVRIPSVEDPATAAPGAPFGDKPREALEAALKMASDMGFSARNVDGYIGYADFPGETEGQIGIIGHVDVVPAGPGWSFEPYAVTRKDGFLIGRGVADDKGPDVVALHALKFWKDLQDTGAVPAFPYTVRFLFGANEETGMGDLAYYQQRYEDPLFLFTPDASFPVSYGEKGLYGGILRSPRWYAENGEDVEDAKSGIEQAISGSEDEGGGEGASAGNASSDSACAQAESANPHRIVTMEGGTSSNAVPGTAFAIVRADASGLPAAPRIAVSPAGEGCVRIEATGKSAHASLPAEGVNAILLVVDYLLENGLCSEGERAFLELERDLLAHTDGSGVGVACADEHFGELTAVGGVIYREDGCLCQTIDIRLPTSTTPAALTERLTEAARRAGCTFEPLAKAEAAPFLVDPESPMIQALLAAYNEATGESAKPFTMGGATYARHFASAASFGPEMPWLETPEWVGGMHGPDEGVSEEQMKKAFRIYALTIGKLMEIDFAQQRTR